MNPADLEQAACKKMHPDVFFPKTEEGVEVAKAVCFRCPVRERCLENAVANHIQFGIFGGYTAKQRRRRFAKPENLPVPVTPKNPAAKVCPSCEAELPFHRFRHNRSRPDRLHGECIQCANRRQASRKKAS